MRELLILAATAMEMRAVALGLELETAVPQTPSDPSRLAHVNGRRIRLALTGVGPLAAAFAAGDLSGRGFLSPETCRGLLCLGIAGTYAPGAAPMGSVAVATREVWPEYGIVTAEGVDAKALGFPLHGAKADTRPLPVWDSLDLDRAAFEALELNDPASVPRLPENPLVVAGASITVAGVSGTRERAKELSARHAALTENMEGFPLALAARRAGIPFAEIRAVSNIVGDRSPSAWNIPAALAALARISVLMLAA